jgi:hypothetical protein
LSFLPLLFSTYFLLAPQPYQGLPSVLPKIIQCESGGNQAAISSTHDFGLFQINRAWIPLAKSMGLDVVNNAQDNIEFGIWLYGRDGTQPWLASKSCWGADDA